MKKIYLRIYVCSVFEEQFHHADVASRRSDVERGHSGVVDFVYEVLCEFLVFYLEEELSCCVVAPKVRAEMKWCVVQRVSHHGLCPAVEKCLDERDLPLDAGKVKRRDE